MTTTFQGQFDVRRLGFTMINLHIKLEVSMFTHYKDNKRQRKCKNWGGLGLVVTQGHWQCLHLIEHIRLPTRL